jgi:hypothetical protein
MIQQAGRTLRRSTARPPRAGHRRRHSDSPRVLAPESPSGVPAGACQHKWATDSVRTPPSEGHAERGQGQCRRERRIERPAHDGPRKQVDDNCEIAPPLVGGATVCTRREAFAGSRPLTRAVTAARPGRPRGDDFVEIRTLHYFFDSQLLSLCRAAAIGQLAFTARTSPPPLGPEGLTLWRPALASRHT